MVGISGTSKTKKTYHYYNCVNSRKKLCDKKGISKIEIEDIVINETRKLLTNENINMIAREVVSLCKKDTRENKYQKERKGTNRKANS